MKNRNLDHKDDWKTPAKFYDELNNEFHFDFDPCPYHHNVDEWDGLQVEWGQSNFVNPPYSRKLKESFIHKAILEASKGKTCVMLLPVSTSTKIFHDFIKPNAKEIRFVRGRLRFEGINTKGELVTNQTPMHDSMVVIFAPMEFKLNLIKTGESPKEVCQSCLKNEACEPHTCPYAEDINGDSESMCNCCSDCEYNCAMDI